MRKTDLVVGEFYELNRDLCDNVGQPHTGNTFRLSAKDRACGAIMKCISNNDGYWGQPIFESVHSGVQFRLSSCASISPKKMKGDARKAKAASLRRAIATRHAEVTELRSKAILLEAEIPALDRKASMLEKYETDEEALAATLSEIMRSNGDPAQILAILQEYGATNKL